MDKFMRKTRGAISIFLVLVMLPMLSVASVFVDMSRLNLAKSMAASAGDLTLNTALTNYDAELKTIYGLFATAQDMDEVMMNLEDYYRDSIMAAGVDSAAADDYVGQIMGYLRTETGTDDIMNIDLTNFEVSVPTGAHLGNPAILKTQIVEFMKYRAPLNLGMGLLDALSSMKNLSKQTKLVEEKNEFYEDHQTMLGKLESAWKELQHYQYADAAANTGFPTGSYITDHAGYLPTHESNVKTAIKDTVLYLYDAGNFKKVDSEIYLEHACPECGKTCTEKAKSCDCGAEWDRVEENQVWKTKWNGGSKTKVNPAYSKDDPATVDEVLQYLNAVLVSIDALEAHKNNSQEAQNVVDSTSTSADMSVRIYAVCKFYKASKDNADYFKDISTFLKNLVNLQSALLTCEDENLSSTKVTPVNDTTYKIETSASGIGLESYAWTQIKAYLNLTENRYLKQFRNTVSRAKNFYDATSDTVEAKKSSVKNQIDGARDEAYEFYNFIDKKITRLSNAITYLNAAKAMIDGTDPNVKYKENLGNWQTAANNLSGDTMAQNDKKEIENITSIVTSDRLASLITRLTNAKTSLSAVRTEIGKYEFAGTAWKDLTDNAGYSNVVTAIKNYTGKTFDTDIRNVVPTSDSSYNRVISQIQETVKRGSVATEWRDLAYHPNLVQDQRDLYTWLYNNYYDKNMNYSSTTPSTNKTENADSDDSDMSKMEKGLKDEADTLNPKGEQVNGSTAAQDITPYLDKELKAIPSTRWDGEKKDIEQGKIETDPDTMLSNSNSTDGNILTKLLSIATDMSTSLRDKMYIAEYIMTMFSYDTQEVETYLKKEGNTYSGFKPFYEKESEDSNSYKVTAGYESYAAQQKTLTKVEISPSKNFLYGEEIEYILYGSGGATGVYGTIFVIRFALNTVYAFTDAEINNCTLAAATALFGTPPLTPLIPIAKAAMIIGLAIAESAWDLVELRKGEAVPLVKNSQTWIMSPSGVASAVKSELVSVAKNAAYDLVDEGYKILTEAMEMTAEELQGIASGAGAKLDELSQAATSTVKDKIQNKANEALQKVVEFCNLENQKAMLEDGFAEYGLGSSPDKVTNVVNQLKAWRDQQDDEPAIKQAKELAVAYLTENNGAVISEIFESIESQSATSTAEAPVLNNVLSTKLDDIKKNIDESISTAINNGVGALGNVVNDITESLKTSAAQGADKLKETLGSYIDSSIGSLPESSGSTPSKDNIMNSLLSWRYSDYLRVFVIIGVLANEELMLLRIADLIELNMQHKTNEYSVVTTTEEVEVSRFFGLIKYTKEEEVSSVNDKAFTLAKSYTYIKINADLQVKPLFMTLPFMAETVENQLTGTNWYGFSYTGMLGY